MHHDFRGCLVPLESTRRCRWWPVTDDCGDVGGRVDDRSGGDPCRNDVEGAGGERVGGRGRSELAEWEAGEFGYACAIGLILFAVILAVTFVNQRLVRPDP